MRRSLDCTMCIIKQTLDAARYATSDESVHEEVLRQMLSVTLDMGLRCDPPLLGTYAHRIVRDVSKDPDPYYKEKKRFNKLAFEQIDQVRKWIDAAEDKFETAVRLAIAGNSIDFALGSIDEEAVRKAIGQAIDQRVVGSIEALRQAVADSKKILYLTDNAGEIVYDRLFIELLTSADYQKDVTVALRGKPILNDALMEDAEEIGLTKVAPCIGNGGDGLGVLFDLTSDEFNKHFAEADLVIGKGLANFETLGAGPTAITPKRIAFLYKAKCPFIAKVSNANLGDLVVRVDDNTK